MQKTINYSLFKFRKDNRAINNTHLEKLIFSIKTKNLLSVTPILVNEEFEVIDGQHRLLAAKALKVEVYYIVEKSITGKDIPRLNISKSWSSEDFLKHYLAEEHPEYKKLKDFMIKNELTLHIAIDMTSKGSCHKKNNDFKNGTYRFLYKEGDEILEICHETIDYIKKINGVALSMYTKSSRFWKGLIKLINEPNFSKEKWFGNLKKFVTHFSPKATSADYLEMFQKTHNWKNSCKVDLLSDEREAM